MTDVTTLRRLAEAAAPGGWTVSGTIVWSPDAKSVVAAASATEPSSGLVEYERPKLSGIIQPSRNAAYIAAMNPATTLALLDELAELRSAIITFCAPWAVTYSKMMGLPPGHIYAAHYDLLEKCGARMVDFVRYEP